LSNLRQRGRRYGLPCTIDIAYLRSIWPADNRCPALDIPMDRRDRNHTPSIDRIDNAKGYVPGNVAIISQKANRLKNSASLAEVTAIYAYMLRRLPA
jgi:hypothetical protein